MIMFRLSVINNRLALLICAVFALLSLTYADAVPLFESSDEAAHFLNAHNLLADRALPIIPSREQIAEETDLVRQWSIESHQPPLYYLISAALISPTQRDDLEAYLQPNPLIFIRGITQDNHHKWLHPVETAGDTAVAVWILRLYSLALSTGTLYLIYRAALLAFGSPSLALTAMLLVAFIPTYLNIGSSVNNDNLVTFLYTAGVYLSLRMWKRGIRPVDIALMSVILAAIALTKITGLTLFGVVYLALLIGVIRKHYTLRQAALVVGCSLLAAAIFAGWWYLRNWTLYGDPIAAAATQTLWGREFAKPTESGSVTGEMIRVWRSFWAMVGHLHNPVYASMWAYAYVTLISVAGGIGLSRIFVQAGGHSLSQPVPSPSTGRGREGYGYTLLILLLVVLLPLLTLAIGTRSVDISYGRLLFPALVGFAPLIVMGWRRLLGRFAPLLVMPLAVLALVFPQTTLPDAYPPLKIVDAVPADATPLNIRTGSLTLLAYQSQIETAAPGDAIRFTLYLTGSHPENPALYLTLLDPITNEALTTAAVYPGMAGTNTLRPDTMYQARFVLPVCRDSACPLPISPRQLKLQLGWQTALNTDYLPMTYTSGDPVSALLLSSATLLDPRYTLPEPPLSAQATFGDAIELYGYEIVKAGETISVDLYWRTLNPLSEDYVATVQLLDAAGTLVTQDDGDIPGYPSSVWREDATTSDQRRLTLPPDAVPGDYRIFIGWYRLSDFSRLSAAGEGAINDLYPLPFAITIEVD